MSTVQKSGQNRTQRYDEKGMISDVIDNVAQASIVTRDKSSVNTPQYMKRLRYLRLKSKTSLDLPMNPFGFELKLDPGDHGSFFQKSTSKSTGKWTVTQGWGDWGVNLSTSGFNSDIVTALDNEALSALTGRLKDQSVNLGVVVGEGRQTINLFVNTAKRVSSSFRAIKRGDFRAAADALGGVTLPSGLSGIRGSNLKRQIADHRIGYRHAIGNAWLELQYGWKPLLSDVFGACEHLANQRFRMPRYKETASKSRTVNSRESGGTSDYFEEIVRVDHTSVKYVVYFSGDENHSLSSLGLVNPLSIAWELVPYSFVADWFIPIGNYLNNLDATSGLNFVKGCRTVFHRNIATKTRTGRSYEDANNVVVNSNNIKGYSEHVLLGRSVLGSFPKPALPGFKNPFSPYHIANALALLSQTFKR